MNQVINPFKRPASEYIVAFKLPDFNHFVITVSYDDLENAQRSLNVHKEHFRNTIEAKIFKAVGNTDRMYIDVQELAGGEV
jgi:hypothetical protein